MATLYSTGCPRCSVLEKKLEQKGVDYNKVTDVKLMLELGIKSAPVLEVNGERMDFSKAIAWVNKL